jgi:hypothetical protein
MGQIYENAKNVVVWLCEATQATEHTLLFLVKVEAHLASKGFTLAGITELYLIGEDTFLKVVGDILTKEHSEGWQAICSLLLQPWWQRSWTVQEFGLGRDVFIAIGQKEISWVVFYFAVSVLVLLSVRIRRIVGLEDHIVSLAEDAFYSSVTSIGEIPTVEHP